MSELRHATVDALLDILGSPRFSAALTQCIIGAELGSLLLQNLIGWPGVLGILGTLVVLASVSLIIRRREIEWHGLLPISLLVFVGWVAFSVFWSQYQWITFGSVVYFGAVTMLGIYVALIRDTIQIARAFGDVLRLALVVSLVLEVLSGVLIDTPLRFLDIQGDLAKLGPIQGIFGTRNELGVITLVAIVTFVTELRTKSVPRGLAVASLILGGLTLALTRSPIAFGTAVVVALATLALYGLRRASAASKRFWQIGLLLVSITLTGLAWGYRSQIITALSASSELQTRLRLWAQIRALIPENFLQGWGWVGHWRVEVPLPFGGLQSLTRSIPPSGMNAFLDVWFQVGFVGLLLFLLFAGLTFVRSWLLASSQRSFVYAWPALMLVVLLTTATAESSVLVEFGWLAMVVCSVKAARELSWRRAFTEAQPRIDEDLR